MMWLKVNQSNNGSPQPLCETIKDHNQVSQQDLMPKRIPNGWKCSLEHFIEHLACTHKTNMLSKQEHMKNLPNTNTNGQNWPTQTPYRDGRIVRVRNKTQWPTIHDIQPKHTCKHKNKRK